MRIINLPHGKLFINDGKAPEIIYDANREVILIPAGDSRFEAFLGATGFVSGAVFTPELVNAQSDVDELLKKFDKFTVFIDALKVDKLGDQIMLTPIPRAYKALYKAQVKVVVGVPKGFEDVWVNNPDVTISHEPVEAEVKIDVNNLELRFRSRSKVEQMLHPSKQPGCMEQILHQMGLWLINKTPKLYLTEDEKKWGKEMVGEMKRPVIGIQTTSASLCRQYPHMKQVHQLLNEKGYSVVVLDAKVQNDKFMWPVREMAAVINACDVIVASDSGILHVAGALKKRVVGIFGNTEGATYCQDYEKAWALQAECVFENPEYEPCWWTVPCLPGSNYQEKDVAGCSKCLEALKPEVVVEAVETSITGPKKIFAAMLTFNCLDMTKMALESIRSWHDLDLCIVDNKSEDGTIQWFRTAEAGDLAPGARIIVERTSVSGAQNLAIKAMIDEEDLFLHPKHIPRNYDYFLLLNNDIVLRRDTIDQLVENVGEKDYAVTSFPLQAIPPWAVDRHMVTGGGLDPIVDIPPGAYSCTLFPASMVKKTGMFDENFHPRYIEDNDYTMRFRLKGGKFWLSRDSVYYHVLGGVVKTNAEQKQVSNKTWDKNIAYYQEKWGIHPHEPQDFGKLGLEWFFEVNGRTVFEEIRELHEKGKKITIHRAMGGWGDHIFASVLARELKRNLPGLRLSYAFMDPYSQVFQGNPYIDEVGFAKSWRKGPGDYDITDLEFRAELHEIQQLSRIRRSRACIYLEAFGIPLIEGTPYKPDYFVSEEERGFGARWFKAAPKIAVVPTGSNNTKSWPFMPDLIRDLKEITEPVVLDERFNFRQAAGVIANADLVVAPDTGLSNAAGALGIPTVCVFGNRSGIPFIEMFGGAFHPVHRACPYADEQGCDYLFTCLGHGSVRERERNVGVLECMKDLSLDTVMELVRKHLA